MEVEIGEVVSTVRAVDSDGLLSPQLLSKITRIVMKAMDERDAHHKRVRAEQRITPGVSHEQEGEGR
ncbi:MAG TPA: hypothetical protein VGN26_17400 [Armatimonadota bacterium]|jgi:hypothetical protein